MLQLQNNKTDLAEIMKTTLYLEKLHHINNKFISLASILQKFNLAVQLCFFVPKNLDFSVPLVPELTAGSRLES